MAELIWQCLIISLVLLFGFNIGLAMGLTQLPRNKILSISLLYGALIFFLSTIASVIPINAAINVYIAYIIGIIGVIIIIGGIYTIIKWRNDKEDHDLLWSKAMFFSSVCLFVGFEFSAILLANSMKSFYLEFNIVMVLVLIIAMMFSYSFSKFLRHAERPYPVLLGNFMILNGLYFLIAGLFIPTLQAMSSVKMSPLSIGTTASLIFLLMAGGGVLLIGVYLKREGITSLNDIYQLKLFNKAKKN